MGDHRVSSEGGTDDLPANFYLVGSLATLPLKSALDPYGEEFFQIVRARFINLVNNGYILVPEKFVIAPPVSGRRMTYGEFCLRQRRHEREVFAKLSEEEKAAAWKIAALRGSNRNFPGWFNTDNGSTPAPYVPTLT